MVLSQKNKANLVLLWVCIGWGSTWVVSKIGVTSMPALQMASIRQFLGGVLLCAFFVAKKVPLPTKKQWPIILLMALLNFVLSNGLSTWGVKFISPGLGAILGAIFPLWLVIIYFFRGRKVKAIAITGMLVGFGGVCLIFYDHLKDFGNSNFQFGIIISIIATITWAFGAMYTQEHVFGFNPYFGLGIQMFISGIVLFFISYFSGQFISIKEIPAPSWWSIAYLVILGSVVTFSAYIYVLKHLPMEIASVYAYMNPVFAILISHFIFPDKITFNLIIGGIITLGGVYLVNRSISK